MFLLPLSFEATFASFALRICAFLFPVGFKGNRFHLDILAIFSSELSHCTKLFFWKGALGQGQCVLSILGVDAPFFSTIVLSKNRLFPLGFRRFSDPGKNGEGTPRGIP